MTLETKKRTHTHTPTGYHPQFYRKLLQLFRLRFYFLCKPSYLLCHLLVSMYSFDSAISTLVKQITKQFDKAMVWINGFLITNMSKQKQKKTEKEKERRSNIIPVRGIAFLFFQRKKRRIKSQVEGLELIYEKSIRNLDFCFSLLLIFIFLFFFLILVFN